MGPVVENGTKDMKITDETTIKSNYYQQMLIKNSIAF